jgi:hypothetical protein
MDSAPTAEAVVQLHNFNRISDGVTSIQPYWRVVADVRAFRAMDLAIIRIKRFELGPCRYGDKWLIIDEIEEMGVNPGRLLGSPRPWIPEFTGVPEGTISAGVFGSIISRNMRPDQFVVRVTMIDPGSEQPLELFDGTMTWWCPVEPTIAGRVGQVFVPGCVIRVTRYAVVPHDRAPDILIQGCELWTPPRDETVAEWDIDTTGAPEEYVCPITGELMHDPYLFPDGHTYEKGAIYRWLATNGVSPLTSEAMTREQGLVNRALKRLINQWAVAKREQGRLERGEARSDVAASARSNVSALVSRPSDLPLIPPWAHGAPGLQRCGLTRHS